MNFNQKLSQRLQTERLQVGKRDGDSKYSWFGKRRSLGGIGSGPVRVPECCLNIAEWSSGYPAHAGVARKAHNLEVASSSMASATTNAEAFDAEATNLVLWSNG